MCYERVDKGKFKRGGGWCELDENENEIDKWNGCVFICERCGGGGLWESLFFLKYGFELVVLKMKCKVAEMEICSSEMKCVCVLAGLYRKKLKRWRVKKMETKQKWNKRFIWCCVYDGVDMWKMCFYFCGGGENKREIEMSLSLYWLKENINKMCAWRRR